MIKRFALILTAVVLALAGYFGVARQAFALPCPPPTQDFPSSCETVYPPVNTPYPLDPDLQSLTVTTGLSSDGNNGVTESSPFVYNFPGNAGQIYRIQAQITRNDNPSPGIEFWVNNTGVAGDGYHKIVQNLDGSPQSGGGWDVVLNGMDSGDYTYYSKFVVKLKVRQTFFNENNVQVRWTVFRREMGDIYHDSDGTGLPNPAVLTPTIQLGGSPEFSWAISGANPSRVLFMEGPNGLTGSWDDSNGIPQKTSGWILPLALNTPGTYNFSFQATGPARFGGAKTVYWEPSVVVQPAAGNPPGPFSLTTNSCFSWPTPEIETNFGPSSGATSYDLQRRTGSGSFVTVYSGTYQQLDKYSDPVSQNTTYEYRVVANNASGSTISTNTLFMSATEANCSQPAPPDPPTLDVIASPTAVAYGGASTISWTSTNATSCTVGGQGGTSGSFSTGPLTADTTYNGSCTGAGGTANDTVTVTVAASSMIFDLTADAASVTYGGSTTIRWTSSNCTTITITTQAPTGNATGNFSTGPLTANATYNGSCTGAGGTLNDSVTVTVNTGAAGGSLDAANCDIIGGWAWDPDFPNTPTTVKIYDNGVFYSSYPAADYRVDLPGNKNHAFTIFTPAAFKNGANHLIQGYAVELNGGPDVSIGSENINCPPASQAVMSFAITYTPKPLFAPTNASLDNSICRKITVNWTYTSNGVEDGFVVYRSLNGTTWTSIATPGSAARTYQDTPPSTNVRYYYKVATHRALNIQPREADSATVNALNLPCIANLTSSNMTITHINGVAYNSTTKIKNGDVLTYRITIVNSGPQSATVARLCANPGSNLSNLQNFTASGSGLSNGGVTYANSQCVSDGNSGLRFNISGTKDVVNNWLITYNNTFTAASPDQPQEVISNSVVIYYSDDEGDKQKTVSSFVISGTTKAQVPTFREVAP